MMPSIELNNIASPCSAAFELSMQDGSSLNIAEVIRVVPTKRLVCKAVWNHQQVYAKLFIGPDAAKYAIRDKAGVESLLNAKIATPKILYFGQLTNGNLHNVSDSVFVMLLESIGNELSDSSNIEALWLQLPLASEARFVIAQCLVQTVAQHHDAGLQQTDLYLKNFILSNEKVYTLDGDGIKPLPNHFNEGQITLRNLSALLSKFDVLELEKWLPQLLKTYADARGWKILPRLDLLQHLITVHRNKVSNHYANKKVFRTCTDVQFSVRKDEKLSGTVFGCKKLNGFLQAHFSLYTWLASAYVQFVELVKIEVLDASLNAPAFKSGNTCTVGLIEVNAIDGALNKNDAQKIVVKRYNIKSVSHALLRAVRKTRAAISWGNAHRLLLLGLPTAAPVALLETRYFFGLLKSKSYFLSAYIDAPDVAEYFANERDIAQRAEAVKQVVELFYRLYLLKISHGDLKASNIKMLNHQPILIDLDSMQQHGFGLIATHNHARDLRRFMRNWQQDERLSNAFEKSFKVIYANHQPLKLAKID